MKLLLILYLGKIISKLCGLLNVGSGSTWPGNIAIMLNKDFVRSLVKKNKNVQIILVAGTNGKTTTTSLLKHLLNNLGYKTFSNKEGANLVNGVASTLINQSDLFGNLKYDFAIFEIDEFSLPLVLDQIKPKIVVILNLFRDQLDRYGEVNTIGLKWFSSLKKLSPNSKLIINGDDPYLYYSSKTLPNKKFYFGVNNSLMNLKKIPHDVDFNYCPSCNNLLEYKSISYAHLGDFICDKCGFRRGSVEDFYKIKIRYPLDGLYNIYNTNAILTILITLLKVAPKKINLLMKDFKPAFGRQEVIEYKGKKIFLLLSKNPAGFNQSINAISKITKNKKVVFLILLNDRIPDGRDVSWIWDVDFGNIHKLAKKIFVSGDRVYDMTLRLKYEDNLKDIFSFDDFKEALHNSLKATQIDEKLYVLTTYSAMLDLRKILVGRKLL